MAQKQPGYDDNPPVDYEVRDPEGEGKRKITVTRRIDRLLYMLEHGRIAEHQFEAGRRLQADFERMTVGGYAVCIGVAGSPSPGSNLADAKCDAMDRYMAAITSAPPITRHVIQSLICEDTDKSLDQYAIRAGSDRRQIMGLLIAGLDALAVHYGLATTGSQ